MIRSRRQHQAKWCAVEKKWIDFKTTLIFNISRSHPLSGFVWWYQTFSETLFWPLRLVRSIKMANFKRNERNRELNKLHNLECLWWFDENHEPSSSLPARNYPNEKHLISNYHKKKHNASTNNKKWNWIMTNGRKNSSAAVFPFHATHYFRINKVWINMLVNNLTSFIFMCSAECARH